jgi:hypothetical protein
MFKRLLLLALLMVALVPVATAQDTPDLAGLARYFPADTAAYFSIRTDQAYFESLDGLITMVATAAGEEVPNGSVLAALDEMIRDETDGAYNYQTAIRDWLGDTLAFAIPNLTVMGEPDAVLVAEIRDREALETLITLSDSAGGTPALERETVGDSTLFRNVSARQESFLVSDTFVAMGRASVLESLFIRPDRMARLNTNGQFTAAVAALPADSYNMIGYLNAQGFARQVLSVAAGSLPEGAPEIDFDALTQAFGVQAFGATIIDDRAFVLDLALIHGETTIMSALGLPEIVLGDMPPVDTAFARHAPADTLAYFQSTNDSEASLAMLDNMLTIGDAIIERYVRPIAEAADDRDTLRELESFDLRQMEGMLESMFERQLGLPLDEVYTIFDGQAAAFLGIGAIDGERVLPALAQVYENGSPEAAAKLIDGVKTLLTREEVPFTTRGNAITLNFNDMGSQDRVPVVLTLGATNDLVVGGTADYFDFAVNPSADNLAATPSFIYEAGLMLPDATLFGYVSGAELLRAAELEGAEVPMVDRVLTPMLDSMGLSAVSGDSASVMRLTLTLKP